MEDAAAKWASLNKHLFTGDVVVPLKIDAADDELSAQLEAHLEVGDVFEDVKIIPACLMSVTRCKACSGQTGVSVRVAIEKVGNFNFMSGTTRTLFEFNSIYLTLGFSLTLFVAV